MSTLVERLPISDTVSPDDHDALADVVRSAVADRTPIYPIGGGTSLDYGLTPKQQGIGLSLAGLKQIIDYPARDMTITVEAGITMQTLEQTLAAEGQQLPFDVPQSEAATLGGVVATNWNGPRRLAYGTVRDHVIGIRAVDGRGVAYSGGGRVVKNVAGYDFCKLLTGSMGTLGVITQLTMRVKPLPERTAMVEIPLASRSVAERILEAMVTSQASPVAIELLAGFESFSSDNTWATLLILFEGTSQEVDWMTARLAEEASALDLLARVLEELEADEAFRTVVNAPVRGEADLVIKASVLPSHVVPLVQLLREQIDVACEVRASAANGVVFARFPEFPSAEVSQTLVGRLHPAVSNRGGSLTVVASAEPDLTRVAVWGPRQASTDVMQAVRQQFDPDGLLNPGRFVV